MPTPLGGPHVAHRLGIPGFAAPAGEPAWRDPEILRQLALLEGALDPHAFLMGDAPTLPDLCIAAMTTYFAATGFPFADHSILGAWYQRVCELPSWRATEAPIWARP